MQDLALKAACGQGIGDWAGITVIVWIRRKEKWGVKRMANVHPDT